jgi:hypothetical protein
MEKLVAKAFEKMQKREHFLRVARDRMGLGRITREMFREQEAAIIEQFKLTEEEQQAYDRFVKMQKQKRM